MLNSTLLSLLIDIQQEQGVSDERFCEMATDIVCSDPTIDKGLMEYDEIYNLVGKAIEKEKDKTRGKRTGKLYPSYLRLIK